MFHLKNSKSDVQETSMVSKYYCFKSHAFGTNQRVYEIRKKTQIIF